MDENEKPIILCVDDEPVNLKLVEAILSRQGYEISVAKSGEKALEKLAEQKIELVLLDIMMPGMSGYEVCRRMKEDEKLQHIPVVMVTTLSDRHSKIKGLEAGAQDFLSKPIDQTELLARVRNLLKLKQFEDFLQHHNSILAEQVAEKTRELRDAYIDTIYRLTLATEYKDEDTYSHIKRISLFTRFLAENLGFDEEQAETMFYASPMHDVGKIGIPDSILLKPGKLDSEEFEVMRAHTLIGGKILQGSDSPILRSAETFALYHHERWDGTGYPFNLAGEDIPVEGRILNLVDQYDALRSNRPYKPALNHETVFEIITRGDERTLPGHFDPRVLEVFCDTHEQFAQIYRENP